MKPSRLIICGSFNIFKKDKWVTYKLVANCSISTAVAKIS